jgi:type VII secretion-associated serine protease mycosin
MPDRPWPLQRLRPELVWPQTRGAGVTVAVVDSGVSTSHPALKDRVLDGEDLIQPGRDGHCDEAGHGTRIAGIIAGREVAGSGFSGIAPDARILPIRVLARAEKTFDNDDSTRIVNGIRRATDLGADVINLSLTTRATDELAAAVQYAIDNDVVVVAASGNTNAVPEGTVGFPAAYQGVIAVGGVDQNGLHLPTSVTGDHVDLSAPGFAISGPAPRGGGFAPPEEGTSFSAAYVSGVAALVRAAWPELSGQEVSDRIIRTADRPPDGWDQQVGTGVVNPYWAVVSISGEDQNEPEAPRQADLVPPEPDRLGPVRVAAAWSVPAAIVIAGMVLGGVSVWRNGRRRGWRPGRPARGG